MKLDEKKRVVIKIGTSTLTHATGRLNIRRVESLVKAIADLQNAGREIVVVSSGAIGVGMGKLGMHQRPADMPTKQALAAIGQCELMYLYDKLFEEYNHTVAQVLLTRDVIDNCEIKENVVNTLARLLELRAIPIINENDTVSVDEIGGATTTFGENDTLSAIVAQLVQADLLVILSDIDGLYDSDPRENPDAKLIPLVTEINEDTFRFAGGKGSSLGTGGMRTKLHAAQLVLERGIDMAIINGSAQDALYDFFDGKPMGTIFSALKNRK